MIPNREVATRNGQTYFVTSNTAGRRPFFRHDHFHLLMTPAESLEQAVQCIKGGFSFRAKRDLSWTADVWVAGFSDHRIRDNSDFDVHQHYIAKNPVKSGLVER